MDTFNIFAKTDNFLCFYVEQKYSFREGTFIKPFKYEIDVFGASPESPEKN